MNGLTDFSNSHYYDTSQGKGKSLYMSNKQINKNNNKRWRNHIFPQESYAYQYMQSSSEF